MLNARSPSNGEQDQTTGQGTDRPTDGVERLRGLLDGLTAEEKAALEDWLVALRDIRDSADSRSEKLRRLGNSLHGSRSLWPLVRQMAQALKLHGWDKRSGPARWTVGGVGVSLLFGLQGAGLAAFGGAIALPVWLVFGAGGAFLGVLIGEVRRARQND